MSEVSSEILTRLKRLRDFAGLFQQELDGIVNLLEPQPQKGSIAAAASTTPEEMQIMAEQFIAQQEQAPVGSKRSLAMFTGPASLLVKHLSPSTIDGGRGFIHPNDSLKMYEESILDAPLSTVMGWPNGFYRNHVSKEVQFLVHNEEHGFFYDGLPGYSATCTFVERQANGNWEVQDLNAMDDNALAAIGIVINELLIKLVDQHGLA